MNLTFRRWTLAAAAILGLLGAVGTSYAAGPDDGLPQRQTEGAPPTPVLQVWLTDPESPDRLLRRQADLSPSGPGDSTDTIFTLDPHIRYQTMDGFGASMTDSAAWAIHQLDPAARSKLMNDLFNPESGLGISFLRQPIGSPDFARSIRSCNDLPPGETDPLQTRFSIEADKEYVIPLLKEALRINPRITIMASPWSPPAWMKTGASMLGASGGVLRPEYYQSYALYFVKFIQAYRAEGIPVHLVSTQNEPAYGPPAYPGMVMSAREEAAFVSQALGPALAKAGLDTRILGWDHNWDKPEHARSLLSDSGASRWLAGTAWHWYGGIPQTMTRIKEEFPSKDIWFTEGGSGRWIGGDTFTGQFKDGIQKAILICRNWSRSLVWWNIALDHHNGPIVFPNTANYGLAEINTDTGTLRQPHHAGWYTLGHFSSFVRPGAQRIHHDQDNQDIHGVAFKNPDGSLVIVAANPYSSLQTARIVVNGIGWEVDIPGDGAITCVIPQNKKGTP